MKPIKNQALFYALSFSWGIIISLSGILVAIVLLMFGFIPSMLGYCLHFTIGNDWGGVNLGVVIITDKQLNGASLYHEHGHAIQNCYLGPLMIFLVAIPSTVRYWYYRICYCRGKSLPPYDSVWFEKQATDLGVEQIVHN